MCLLFRRVEGVPSSSANNNGDNEGANNDYDDSDADENGNAVPEFMLVPELEFPSPRSPARPHPLYPSHPPAPTHPATPGPVERWESAPRARKEWGERLGTLV